MHVCDNTRNKGIRLAIQPDKNGYHFSKVHRSQIKQETPFSCEEIKGNNKLVGSWDGGGIKEKLTIWKAPHERARRQADGILRWY